MFSAAASSFFALRNIDKTKNKEGEVGRGAVAWGQTVGVVQEVAKYDGAIANTARSALSVFSDLAKEHKAFEYAGKATQFAVNNVNPLICVSGVIKTALADDKVQTGVTEAAALAAMFAGEGITKKYYDKAVGSETFKKAFNYLSNSRTLKPLFKYLEKNKLNGKVALIAKGLTFDTASMTSYAIGEQAGGNLAPKVKAYFGDNKV